MNKGLEKIELLKSLANDGRVAYDITKYNEWLKTIEKELKALENIKNKRVDVDLLLMSDNVEDYNKHCHKYINVKTQLIQEEYDLLKEVLL